MDALDVVNLRVGGMDEPNESSIEEQFATLAELQRQGLIRQLGLSNVTSGQLKQASGIAKVVCVQNHYNLVHRDDDALIDELVGSGVAYVPFFPLGGFTPLQSSTLSQVATRLGATPMQVALAWLLHRAPNILLIPGTSSIAPPTSLARSPRSCSAILRCTGRTRLRRDLLRLEAGLCLYGSDRAS